MSEKISNSEIILGAMPLLETYQLDNVTLSDDYLSCRFGDFTTRMILLLGFEIGRKLKVKPEKYFQVTNDNQTDPLNVAFRYVQKAIDDEKLAKFAMLRPTDIVLQAFADGFSNHGADSLSHVLLPLAASYGDAFSEWDKGERESLRQATPDELFSLCKLEMIRCSNLIDVYAEHLGALASAWEVISMEEQSWFPDFASQIAELQAQVKTDMLSDSLVRHIYGDGIDFLCSASEQINAIVPVSSQPFSHFVDVYLNSQIGVVRSFYVERAMQMLDYHINLTLGE